MSHINSRALFEIQFKKINFSIVTAQIIQNIDHILISNSLNCKETFVFIDEKELKDAYHKGVLAIID